LDDDLNIFSYSVTGHGTSLSINEKNKIDKHFKNGFSCNKAHTIFVAVEKDYQFSEI